MVTALSLAIIVLNFSRVSSTVEAQGGNPLNDAQLVIMRKVALLSRLDFLRDSSLLPRVEDVSKAYDEKLTVSTMSAVEAATLRAEYVIVMLALEHRAQAMKALKPLLKTARDAPLASALQDAFDLKAHGKQASPPLPASTVRRDRRALSVLDGWTASFAQEALARREGDAARADGLKNEIYSKAEVLLVRLVLIVVVLALNFVAGIVVLVIWLVRGREWNLASLPDSIDDAPASAPFDPLRGWSMLLAFQLLSIVAGGFVYEALESTGLAVRGQPLGVLLVQLILYAMALVLIRYVIRGQWSAIGLHFHHFWRSAAAGLALFWGAFVVLIAAMLLISLFTHSSQAQNNPVFHVITEAGTGMEKFFMLALVGGVGPLFEEILFRGVIYTSMRRVMSSRVAIPLNGFLFASIHGDFNALLQLTILGMLLAYGFERTRSIATSAVTHCLWNSQMFLIFITLLT